MTFITMKIDNNTLICTYYQKLKYVKDLHLREERKKKTPKPTYFARVSGSSIRAHTRVKSHMVDTRATEETKVCMPTVVYVYRKRQHVVK